MDNLYVDLCSFENLFLAYKKAKKGKTTKPDVIEFEKNLLENLLNLKNELIFHTYKPKPLKTFIIRDPKTRKISKSDFRDRIVHHALCNIIEPIFDQTFIYDSYANRKGKGVLKAIERFDEFKIKVSKNNTRNCYVLKADIKHYFDTVNHNILIAIIRRKIKDEWIIQLIKLILENYKTKKESIGMPLGNLTSQFFANIYLNELDRFVKHKLKAKYYIRYVDDFVILHNSKQILKKYEKEIDSFLINRLALELHPEKSKVILLNKGITFLGLRIFFYHRLITNKNLNKFKRKLNIYCKLYDEDLLNYDKLYDFLEGWIVYMKNANTFKLRNKIMLPLQEKFKFEVSSKEVNRLIKEERRYYHSANNNIKYINPRI